MKNNNEEIQSKFLNRINLLHIVYILGNARNIGLLHILVLVLLPWLATSQSGTLKPDQIKKLVPNKIDGYTLSDKPQARTLMAGTLRYSLCEKVFKAKSDRKIKILLFDYIEAPIMYNQALRRFETFSSLETDSLILRSFTLTNSSGWGTYRGLQKSSQLMMGIAGRYFITIEGSNVTLEALEIIARTFGFEDFPQ